MKLVSLNMRSFLEKTFLFVFFVLTLTIIFKAQQLSIDLSFDAAIGGQTSNMNLGFTELSDGKYYVYGYQPFQVIGGQTKSKLVRFNADGTFDNSFQCRCDDFEYVEKLVVQPDGNVVISGGNQLKRLFPDGTIDQTYINPFPNTAPTNVIKVRAGTADGKIYASYASVDISGATLALVRLNTNGSIDNTFQSLNFDERNLFEYLGQVKIQPDGKLLIAGKHQFGNLFRVNTDGSRDNTFESPSVTIASPATAYIYDFDYQSDGKLVFIGRFSSVNGFVTNNFARLNANGSIDTSFTPPVPINGRRMKVISGDRIMVESQNNDAPIYRLNANGSIDNSFSFNQNVYDWKVLASEKIIYSNYVCYANCYQAISIGRINQDSTTDSSFNKTTAGLNGEVRAMAIQPDGKILVTGLNSSVKGVLRGPIARINPDGTLDSSFSAGTADIPRVFAFQSDGKILAGGSFTNYNGEPREALVRLNVDGSVDQNFNPTFGGETSYESIEAITVQPDGKILIGGTFNTVGGFSRRGFARLNSDGTLDTSLNVFFGNVYIFKIDLLPDGKMLIGGSFTNINGSGRNNLARLNSDGTVDQTFTASVGYTPKFIRQADGKIVYIQNPQAENQVRRLNADGSADNTFSAPAADKGHINDISVDEFGNVILVGDFLTVGGVSRKKIARLKPNGQLDTQFFSDGANNTIFKILRQNDGKYLVGGIFSSFEKKQSSGLVRFSIDSVSRRTRFDFDGDSKTDISIFRPSNGEWWYSRSIDNQVFSTQFGSTSDRLIPADYTGDGKTDIALWRESSGQWFILRSENNSYYAFSFGAVGDIPAPGDFDGDGKADVAVFRPSTGTWYIQRSSDGGITITQFGATEDKPVIADYDGDGKDDLAIFRPSVSEWWINRSTGGVTAVQFGQSGDRAVPGDYTGDGKADIAFYRPTSGEWFILRSENNSYYSFPFGTFGDLPTPGDYDGDGRFDASVFRPSNSVWYLLRSTSGFTAIAFGASNDKPIPGAFVP